VASALAVGDGAPGARAAAGAAPGASQDASQDATLPQRLTSEDTRHKIILRPDEQALYVRLTRSGAVVHDVDYGSYRLLVVDERLVGGRRAFVDLGTAARDEQNLIGFSGAVLDTTRPRATARRLPPALRQAEAEDAAAPDSGRRRVDLTQTGDGAVPLAPGLATPGSLFVVQLIGPVKDEWLEAVRATGATIVAYVPANAYVVRARGAAVQALRALRRASAFVQFIGRFEPGYRLSPPLRDLAETAEATSGGAPPIDVTVQVTMGTESAETLQALRSIAIGPIRSHRVLDYLNVAMRVSRSRLTELAQLDGVFAVDERRERRRLDEVQGMIFANRIGSDGRATGPGYLAWLAAKGFASAQFGSFVVNIVDDATSLQGHPDIASGRVAFELNPSGQSGAQAGHGFFNAHIAGGMNDSTGSAYQDASGYHYGLGIAPFARVGATAVFGPGSTTATAYESDAYALGARISSNSWGYDATRYNVDAQEVDAIVRDAQRSVAGQQPMVMVFAAGNDGARVGAGSVKSPATAKNVIAVGASENDRPTGTDGCGRIDSDADNANDLAPSSSRGPVNSAGGDGRFKPDLVAPGVHLQAGVPQSGYDVADSGLCDAYWPSGQTLYSWSSGTSHATPAVAGAAALVYQYFLNRGWSAPSPAMVKAQLMNSARYLTGRDGNDTLPSNAQGMGRIDLERAFDGGDRILVDQSVTFGASGETYQRAGLVSSSAEPVRITLAWTDAPGPTVGAPWVNDLDLEVTVNGTTYKGNVFSGAASVAGGVADGKNNVESVFLPAGVTGTVTIRVVAINIAGDGVPGTSDGTDQDFALVAQNVNPSAAVSSVAVSPDLASPQMVGTVVTMTASATGGTAPLAYKWWVFDGTTWSNVRDWSAERTFAWTLPAAGASQFGVWARSAGQTADTAEAIAVVPYTVSAAPAGPTVTGVVPNYGPVEGGTAVTIVGAGFNTGATVRIGGVPATAVVVPDATSLTATTGAHASGTADVVVTNVGGSPGTLTNGFAYVAAAGSEHPADRNGDVRLGINEVTAYGAAWKLGHPWPMAPVPIPVGYVTRAGYLWRVGETYRLDAGDCPSCWVSTVATPARLRTLASEAAAIATLRVLPATAAPGAALMVTIELTLSAGVTDVVIDETPPAGWTVDQVSADGMWDAARARVRLGPFGDAAPRTLTYRVTPRSDAAGEAIFIGVATSGVLAVPIGGTISLTVVPRR